LCAPVSQCVRSSSFALPPTARLSLSSLFSSTGHIFFSFCWSRIRDQPSTRKLIVRGWALCSAILRSGHHTNLSGFDEETVSHLAVPLGDQLPAAFHRGSFACDNSVCLSSTLLMPSYGSLHSPSLRKHNMLEPRRGGKFNFGRIIGDPFALATISISLVGCFLFPGCASLTTTPPQLAWIITFIASIVADVKNPYPKYAWWTVAYMLCCIIGITVVFASDSADTYSMAVCIARRPARVMRLTSLDRGIPGGRTRHDYFCGQFTRVRATRNIGSRRGRVYSFVHGRRKLLCFARYLALPPRASR